MVFYYLGSVVPGGSNDGWVSSALVFLPSWTKKVGGMYVGQSIYRTILNK